jgi:hypothetical protein
MEGRSGMHRRNLILRRFGALTFGIGYFENGEWVDHLALPDRGADVVDGATAEEGEAMQAVHVMLSCCGPQALSANEERRANATPTPIAAAATRSAIRVLQPRGTHDDAVSSRSTAL